MVLVAARRCCTCIAGVQPFVRTKRPVIFVVGKLLPISSFCFCMWGAWGTRLFRSSMRVGYCRGEGATQEALASTPTSSLIVEGATQFRPCTDGPCAD
jgi:hypothetical protein